MRDRDRSKVVAAVMTYTAVILFFLVVAALSWLLENGP